MVHRRVWQFLMASALLAALSLIFWLVAGVPEDLPQSELVPMMAQQIRINTFRLSVLERRVDTMDDAHQKLLWLLIGNLAATTGALVTYVMTHQRRRRDGEP